MEKLSDIIKKARKDMGLSQAQLAKLYGSGQTTISEWESGKVTQIRDWERLAAILHIPRHVFLKTMTDSTMVIDGVQRLSAVIREQAEAEQPKGLGKIAALVKKNQAVIARQAPQMSVRDVPVYGRAQGGPAGEFEFNGEVMGWESRPPMLEGVPDAYAIYVDGDSMYPRYKPGETVWINPSKPPSRGDDVIVQLHPVEEHGSQRGFIKEFVKWSPNHLVVCQHNPAGELTYDRNDVKTMHTIVFSQK